MKHQKATKYKVNKSTKKEVISAAPEAIADSSIKGPHNRVIYLIIFILTFLLYGNTLTHDYALDDAIVILKISLLRKVQMV